jgi:hypothetical protein
LGLLDFITLKRNSKWASLGGNVVMPDWEVMLRRANPRSAVSVE